MRSTKQGRIPEGGPLLMGAPVAPGRPRGSRRRFGTLVALGALSLTTIAGAAPAHAFDVDSAALTWEIPHEPSPGTGTLSNYATTIGNDGGTGGVTATGPAAGGPITSASTPSSAAGAKYPFTFPSPTSGTIGSYDPVAKTGSIQLAGTVTFTAHGGTFFSVVNPRLSFDAPQSVRVVATGLVAAGGVGSTDPPTAYGGTAGTTVFALDGTGATTTVNPDGSYTIGNLIASGTPTSAPTSYLSSNTTFDPIRPWFVIERANQRFSVTFTPAAAAPPAQCADTIDNDGDGLVDLLDPGCTSATDNDETNTVSQTLPVTGGVDDALGLTLGQASASLGTFVPGLATDYATTLSASVLSTGPATLSVVDPGASPGFLTNGTAKLASALQARAINATTTGTYSTVSGSPATLLSYPAAANDAVTIGLKQAITASEPLTAGTYGKTLTFTVSATTP